MMFGLSYEFPIPESVVQYNSTDYFGKVAYCVNSTLGSIEKPLTGVTAMTFFLHHLGSANTPVDPMAQPLMSFNWQVSYLWDPADALQPIPCNSSTGVMDSSPQFIPAPAYQLPLARPDITMMKARTVAATPAGKIGIHQY